MKFTIQKEEIIKSLKKINVLLGTRTDLPILSNILVFIKENYLFLTSTNLEIEITTKTYLKLPFQEGKTTVPGKKFLDICRSFPKKENLIIFQKENKIIITSKKIFFSLITLPHKNFPIFPNELKKKKLIFLFQKKF
ncbi:MAG TPA: hypothetical protein VFP07_00090 [Buchnera sp. (in: enterobacteria)]|nr:hypothetical protein [Buchnera sp. (in: enterobacteria)]